MKFAIHRHAHLLCVAAVPCCNQTSAKNNINVEEAFIAIARDIKKRLMDNPAAAAGKPAQVTARRETRLAEFGHGIGWSGGE